VLRQKIRVLVAGVLYAAITVLESTLAHKFTNTKANHLPLLKCWQAIRSKFFSVGNDSTEH
jgi:hypothetical protein